MAIAYFPIKHGSHFALGQSASGVAYRHLYASVIFFSAHLYPSAFRCELTCVVSQCVYHEKREYAVGFECGRCGSDHQVYTLGGKGVLVFGDDVEEFLKSEAYGLERELSFGEFYPSGQRVVSLVYLVDEFGYVFFSELHDAVILFSGVKHPDFVDYSVDKW